MADREAIAARLAFVRRRQQRLQEMDELDLEEAKLSAMESGVANVPEVTRFGPAATPTPSIQASQTPGQVGHDDNIEEVPKKKVKKEVDIDLSMDSPEPLPEPSRQELGGRRARPPVSLDGQRLHGQSSQTRTELDEDYIEPRTSRKYQRSKTHIKVRFGPVVGHKNFATVIRAVDDNEDGTAKYVELACNVCRSNCFLKNGQEIRFYKGAYGLESHIRKSHPNDRWAGFSVRSVAERCVKRVLTSAEVDAVLNGRYEDFAVDPVAADQPWKRKRAATSQNDEEVLQEHKRSAPSRSRITAMAAHQVPSIPAQTDNRVAAIKTQDNSSDFVDDFS